MVIYLRYNYKLCPGQRIEWRDATPGSKWERGTVDKYDEVINHLFLSRG